MSVFFKEMTPDLQEDTKFTGRLPGKSAGDLLGMAKT